MMDRMENLKLQRQLLQCYWLVYLSPIFQVLKRTILLAPSYTRSENSENLMHTKGNIILLRQHVHLKASRLTASPEEPQQQSLIWWK